MTPAITLSLYIFRQFALAVTGDAAGADRAGRDVRFHRAAAPLRQPAGGDIRHWSAEIAALRLPYVAMQILPFAVLLGGILCFWRLTRSSELIVARAAGVSAWEFLAAPTFCALLFGVVAVTARSARFPRSCWRAPR